MGIENRQQGLRGRSFWALIVTQFLGAFNDNAFKMIVMLVVSAGLAATEGGAAYLAGSTAVFSLAYILFSSWAGHLSDRFSKSGVITATRVAEVLIMLLAFAALWTTGRFDWRVAPIIVLFLMAVQSTFFSPAKYGILPEILDDEELSQGNGIMNMMTYAGIILGTAASGWLMVIGRGRSDAGASHYSALVLAGIAGVSGVSSLFIRRLPPAGERRRMRRNPFTEMWANLRVVRADRPLFVCVLANTYLWSFGAMYLQNFVPYARESLGITADQTISTLLGVWSIGVGLGSLLAGKLSDRKVEFGMVPFGGAGMAVCSILLAFIPLAGAYRARLVLTAGNLAALGLFAGFYFVPINAFVQQRSPSDRRGKTIAALNFVTFAGMMVAAFTVYFLAAHLRLNPALTFAVIGLTAVAATVALCVALPTFLVRLVVWLATHTVWRFRRLGLENVPKSGPALLVSNHVSLADAAVIAACFQRPVRFVMDRSSYEHPLLHWATSRMGAIPWSPDDPPEEQAEAFREARKALVDDGGLVCIFAEGEISRTRNLLRFRPEFEDLVEGTDVPVIPMHLDRVWGGLVRRRSCVRPRRRRSPTTVSFGRAMPSRSKAHEVRTVVAELAADAFDYRRGVHLPLHRAFIRAAKLNWRRTCLADPNNPDVRYGRLLTMASLLSRSIRRMTAGQQYVGLMLPPTVAGAAANIATLFAGKIPVNLNYASSAKALDAAIARCDIKTILTARKFVEKAGLRERPEMVMLEDVAETITPLQKVLAGLKCVLLPADVLCRLHEPRRVRPDDPATVVFTSGSTGLPKGVVLTHRNIAANIVGFSQVLSFEPDDCLCGVLPFFHSFGFTAGLWAPVLLGLRTVYHANPLDAETIGRLIREHRATLLIGTPTFLQLYARKCEREDLAGLRVVICGAEKMRSQVADRFEDAFGVRPIEGYGCTELAPVAAVNIPADRVADPIQPSTREGTIGPALPNVAARVVDAETGDPLPPNEEGLLLFKGPNVMLGYLDDPEATDAVMDGGWYRTGDIARIDEDGFITVTDRVSRFTKIAGETIPHMALEDAIHEAAGLDPAELRCVVTSVPDERKGERILVLYTDLGMDIGELVRRLSRSGLPNLWVPRRGQFHRISEIPVLGSGKLDLKSIRRMAAEAAG